MNLVLFILAMGYACIAICVFRFVYNVNEHLKQRRHYNKHPERYGAMSVWSLAIISILWPLQVIGLFIYLCGLYKRW